MCINIETIREGIQQDYEKLCKILNIKPVPLDIYIFIWGSQDKTDLETPIGNGTPIYDQVKIVLPLIKDNLSDIDFSLINFPPIEYNFLGNEWPEWRKDLWHETCHQVQDIIIKIWNPHDGADGHKEGWGKAKEYMATTLKIPVKNIKNIITP